MRIYIGFREALSEIKRDLSEMGIRVHPHTYQDKFVADNPDFATLELQNYGYTVTRPKSADLTPTQPWADEEWKERVSGMNGAPVNPGTAWKLREEVWCEFLQSDGTFAYSYGDRFSRREQIKLIINRIKEDPDSRQLFISVYDPSDILKMGGISRIPCSLGYIIQIRKGKLNFTYLQRSVDFVTHFQNDVYLAVKMQEYLSEYTHYPPGNFTHFVNSLHMFKKDAQGVF